MDVWVLQVLRLRVDALELDGSRFDGGSGAQDLRKASSTCT